MWFPAPMIMCVPSSFPKFPRRKNISMKKFSKAITMGALGVLCTAAGGCNSIVDSHRLRLEKIYRAHDEIATISSQLQDIEQVMLYAGRIKDPPIATLALDVAIAIHGEPDEAEKVYASNITTPMIEREMARVEKLLKRKNFLVGAISSEKNNIPKDLSALSSLETKYLFFSKLFTRGAIALGVLLSLFLFLKFLL
jgi:hypothetical protein